MKKQTKHKKWGWEGENYEELITKEREKGAFWDQGGQNRSRQTRTLLPLAGRLVSLASVYYAGVTYYLKCILNVPFKLICYLFGLNNWFTC